MKSMWRHVRTDRRSELARHDGYGLSDSAADGRRGCGIFRPHEEEKHVAVHRRVLAHIDDQEHDRLCEDSMRRDQMIEAERMNEHLATIRKSVGFTREEIAKKLGVSRQLINALESHRLKVRTITYLALRKILDDEIKADTTGETLMLRDLLDILIDHPERYPDVVRSEAKEYADMFSESVVRKKSSRKAAVDAWFHSPIEDDILDSREEYYYRITKQMAFGEEEDI